MRAQKITSIAALSFAVFVAMTLANDLIPAASPELALGPHRKLGSFWIWWGPMWCDPFWCDGISTFLSVVATILIVIGLIWCCNYHYRRHRYYFRRHRLLGKRATIVDMDGEYGEEANYEQPNSFKAPWTEKFDSCFGQEDLDHLEELLPHLDNTFLKRIGLNMPETDDFLAMTARSVRQQRSPIDPALALNFAQSHQTMSRCIAQRLLGRAA